MIFSNLPPAPPAAETIIVTAALAPEPEDRAPASVTVIDPDRVERLGEPLLANLLRLAPSVSLATAGPAGSQAQVRIRGAEANHTLLFIDGIRANDPAAGNEPRFELLSADLADGIEVVRGPQSALWGSEAIGGVVALTASPRTGASASAEAGSHGFGRVGGSAGLSEGGLRLGIAAGVQGAEGINAFAGGPGDRDGYRNAVLRGHADWTQGPFTLSASGFAIRAKSDFDGFDPVFFVRADTADQSRNRLAAGRIGGRFEQDGWTAALGASRLGSRNRNLLGGAEQNRTGGRRDTLAGTVGKRFTLAGAEQRLTAAAEWNRERFTASDQIYGGFTDQRRRRSQSALTGEYQGDFGQVTLNAALRRDHFSDFKDATTARLGAIARLGSGLSLAASWGEGIAQPTFFDLYGFFPGSYVGNPDLKPERSRGGEISLRYAAGPWRASATVYRQHLRDEIVGTYDPDTFLSSAANADGRSKREGLELEAGWSPGAWLALTATYAYLDATEPAGRELRRPKHSGSVAADGTAGHFRYGAALSYTGARLDRDFDLFPAPLVRLDGYWLASARVGYRVTRRVELFGRIANAFDSRTIDVVGYRSEGRTAYAGIRLLGG
ncbi:TonB-dependent receptor [Sphingomonas astaxanthinifaciens DSM 22298]|uniref:TonB-dependent receptor n=1 Tax=Sphingomonas astaxanthinifaciens DSM 22298 TaxID=1123267 RepID=A0ABQ5Z5L4_9SPHN|nr:TonB-dependent receptor [Sphingomonas astaxanthinifaciens DSM 22298]